MQFNVLSELRQPIGSTTNVAIDEPSVQLNGFSLRDLAASLDLLRTDRGLLASFTGGARVREKCARCLAETECDVEIRFEEEFVPFTDANTGARIRIRPDDEVFRIGADFTLDLTDALRQYFLIMEPLKPLCRPDCAGLCPNCGANLNEGACGCPPDVDERWSALAGLQANRPKGI
jgi:uncharacterized protein